MAIADNVNHPAHYTNREHECIDEMIAVFGKDTVIDFCKCNAWKYRYRAGSKGNYEEDMEKSDWYISEMMKLMGISEQHNKEKSEIDQFVEQMEDILKEERD